jgi:hypothetical protein
MPCERCGSTLILIDSYWQCPKCLQVNLCNENDAHRISINRIKLMNDIFTQYFQKFSKKRLITHIVWAREKFARNFFDDYQGFEIPKFLTLNLLIKRLMRMSEQSYKNEIEANDKLVDEIIRLFSEFIMIYNSHVLLRNGFFSMIYKTQYVYENLSAQQLLSNFTLVPNESYKPLLLTFENNNILNKSQSETKIKKYKEEFEEIIASKINEPKKEYSPKEFIEFFYPTINQFYCSLLINSLFARVFDFKNTGFTLLSPQQLMDFVNRFQMVNDYQTVTKREDFLKALGHYCQYTNQDLEKYFIFDESNQQIFPLFVGTDDYIFISHRTSFLIHIFLMAFFHRELFDRETEKRSKELEKNETKKEFEKIGFRYIPNIIWKNHLEIDGLAIKNDIAYVIECKEWGIRPLYEHCNIQFELERDLKGIVDGNKYSTIDGIPKIEPKVSLPTKIEYVRKNQHKWALSNSTILKGLVVMRDYPPITSYKDVKIISLNEIKTLDS